MLETNFLTEMEKLCEVANKLGDVPKEQFNYAINCITSMANAVGEDNFKEAFKYAFPLLAMLTLSFLQEFVVKNLSQADAMELLLTSLFESKEKDLNNEN
jgi:hypothetical protein